MENNIESPTPTPVGLQKWMYFAVSVFSGALLLFLVFGVATLFVFDTKTQVVEEEQVNTEIVYQWEESSEYKAFVLLESVHAKRDVCNDDWFFKYKYNDLLEDPQKLHVYNLIKNSNPELDCFYTVVKVTPLTDDILLVNGGYLEIGPPVAYRGWRINKMTNEVKSIDEIFPTWEVDPVTSSDSRYLVVASSTVPFYKDPTNGDQGMNDELIIDQFFVYDIVTDSIVLDYQATDNLAIGAFQGGVGSALYTVFATWTSSSTFEVSAYNLSDIYNRQMVPAVNVKTFTLP